MSEENTTAAAETESTPETPKTGTLRLVFKEGPDTYGLMKYLPPNMKRGIVWLPRKVFTDVDNPPQEITILGEGLVQPEPPKPPVKKEAKATKTTEDKGASKADATSEDAGLPS